MTNETEIDIPLRQKQLFDLNNNLNILMEREAKYGGNPPLELLNQIDDHRQAIDLIRQALNGDLTDNELQEALKPLLLALRNGQVINITAETYVAGDLIQNITHILSAAEQAAQAQELATQRLAEGVRDYLQRLQAIITAEPERDGSPYKGLLAYRLSDAGRFFGRDRAIDELLAQLQHGPLTVLHAESGAGKSSLLQAGIANQLLGQERLPVYLRPYNQSPTLAIKQAFLPHLADTPELAGAPLRDFLRRVTGVLGQKATLYLMLDQFEEFFTLLDDAARSEFVAQLAGCLEDEGLNVRWVLALRTEFFGNLANFRPRIRNPFENDYRLNRLTPAEAETVIIEPAAQQGIRVEPELVEALLNDLRDPDSDDVAPPQIQLVCSALYSIYTERQAVPAGLPPTITLQMYNEQGQAQGILRGHLNRVLRRILNHQEREAARQLLIALVSSDQRRIRRSKSDLVATLATYLTAAMSLDNLLDQLVESRLLNVEEDETSDEPAYELAHDYLLTEIKIDPEVQARKAAEELLEQEVKVYQQHRTLLTGKKFEIINSQQEFLALDDDAAELLRLSQVAHRRAQLLRFGTAALIILLIVGGAIAFAFYQTANAAKQATLKQTAEASEAEAVRQQRLAQVQAMAALAPRVADQTRDSELATLLAYAAFQQNPAGPDSQYSLIDNSLRQIFSAPYFNNTLTGHNHRIQAAAFSPDGRWLATGSEDRTVRLWDLAALNEDPPALIGHQDDVTAVTFSPDGQWLASSSLDKTVQVWDLDEVTRPPLVLGGYDKQVNDVAFSPDGRWLATSSGDGTVSLRDTDNFNEPPTILPGDFEGWVDPIAFSQDEQWLAAGGEDGTILIWSMTDLQADPQRLPGHEKRINALAFSPDNRILASGGQDLRLLLWDTTDFTQLEPPANQPDGYVRSLVFSPNGQWLVAALADRLVWLWDTTDFDREPTKLGGHRDWVNTVDFSPDSRWLVTGSGDHTARLWDFGTPAAIPRKLTDFDGWPWSLDVSPDGQWLAVGANNPLVKLWPMDALDDQPVLLPGHKGRVNTVAFSPDNRWLASGSNDQTVRLWSTADWTAEPEILKDHPGWVNTVAFRPDSRQLATGSLNTVFLWDLSQLDAPTEAFEISDNTYINSLAYHPDGQQLAGGSSEGDVWLWDLSTAKPGPRLTGHQGSVNAVAFSDDGRWLASGGADKTVRLWPTPELDQPLVLEGANGRVRDLVFSPDSQWLAAAIADDRTIRVWQVSAPEAEPIVLTGHDNQVTSVDFDPEGRYLISASGDQTVWVWPTFNNLLEMACGKIHRNLSWEEWQQYIGPQEPYRLICDEHPVHPGVVDHALDFARAGQIDTAIVELESLLALDPRLKLDPAQAAQQAYEDEIKRLLDEGNALARQGNIAEAVAVFQQALELNPDLELNPAEQAAQAAQPTFANAIDEAIAAASRGDHSAAQAAIEQAAVFAAALESAEAWHQICTTGGRWEMARLVIEACHRAVEMEPENGAYRNSRGIVLLQLGQDEAAREDFQMYDRWQERDQNGR